MGDFSKRHYEQIAEALARSYPSEDALTKGLFRDKHMQWEYTVREICTTFVKDNPRFKLEFFLQYLTSRTKGRAQA